MSIVFVEQGMFSPEREPHPAVAEIRYLMQPVMFFPREAFASAQCVRVEVSEEKHAAGIHLSIKNRYTFSTLEHLEWSWTVTSNRSSEPIRTGSFALNDPKGKLDVYVDLESVISRIILLEKSRPAGGNSYFLNIQGSLKVDVAWAKAGHVLVEQQIPVKFVFEKPLPLKKVELKPAEHVGWRMESGKVIVERQEKNGAPTKLVLFNPRNGAIESMFSKSGDNILEGSVLPNFCRAATDNDKGGLEQPLEFLFPGTSIQSIFGFLHRLDEFSYWSRWKHVGLDASAPPTIECTDLRMSLDSEQTQVQACASCQAVSSVHGTILFDIQIVYTIWADGRVNVRYHVEPASFLKRIGSLPRVGMKMALVSILGSQTSFDFVLDFLVSQLLFLTSHPILECHF